MDEETKEEARSRQEEARRILDAIRQKESTSEEQDSSKEKVIPRLPSEDAAQLEDLITNTILSKAPQTEEEKAEELIEAPEINPISIEQIKVMRKFAANKSEVKEPLRKMLAEAIIRGYFEIIAYFTPSSRVQRCQKEGHICMNCGTRIPIPKLSKEGEDKEPDESSKPTVKKRTW